MVKVSLKSAHRFSLLKSTKLAMNADDLTFVCTLHFDVNITRKRLKGLQNVITWTTKPNEPFIKRCRKIPIRKTIIVDHCVFQWFNSNSSNWHFILSQKSDYGDILIFPSHCSAVGVFNSFFYIHFISLFSRYRSIYLSNSVFFSFFAYRLSIHLIFLYECCGFSRFHINCMDFI